MDIINTEAVTKQKEQIEYTRTSLGSFISTEKLKVHKQKSLLQFFCKSPATTSGSFEEQIVDLVHGTCEPGVHVFNDLQNEVIKTPDSNKENAEIIEIEKVTVDEQYLNETKTKSNKKKNTEKSKNNCEINEPVDAIIKYNNISEIDRKSEFAERNDISTVNERVCGGDQIDKHGERHKRKCEEIENNSDSVSLISNTSSSNQSSIRLNSESCKQELQPIGPEIGIEKKYWRESKLSRKEEETIETSPATYTDSKTLTEVECDIDGVSFPKTSETDTSQKVNVCSFSELENVAFNEKVENINLSESHQKPKSEENIVNVKNDFERDSKKKTLKGKDMLNILKEIKEDFTDTKKKKHKKKHKREGKSKMSEIEIHKITHNGQCNESHEGEESDIAKTSNGKDIVDSASAKQSSENVEIRDKKNAILEPFNEIRMGMCQTDKRSKKDLKHLKSLHKECTDRTTNVQSSSAENKSVKNMHNKLGTKSLSYDNLKKKINMGEVTELENKIINNDTKSVKEMSYTEYLEKLKTEEVNIKCTSLETTLEDGEKAVVTESNLSKDTCTENENSKENIKSFFNSLTSTPDDIKQHNVNTIVNSNVSARKDKKLKKKSIAGKKIKSQMAVEANDSETAPKDVIKSVNSQSVKSQSDEAIDDELPIESRTCKIDPPIKNVCLGKKTQATLSFGRTGLTFIKPSPMPAEKVVKTGSRDTKGRQFSEASKLDKFVSEQDETCKQAGFDDTDVLEMPVNVKTKAGKNKDISFTDGLESVERRCSERQRSLRNRYTVEAFQMDADRKTPIKIKLKMCPKNSGVGNGDFVSLDKFKKSKKNIQLSTANALLKKAKRGIPKLLKGKTDEDAENISRDHRNRKKLKEKDLYSKQNCDNSNNRRSSRLVGKAMPSMEEVSLDNIVISSDEDDDATTQIRKFGKHKGPVGKSKDISDDFTIDLFVENTPKKKDVTQKHKKPPSKTSGVKLAPMFLMGKNKAAEPSPKTPAIDPEILKQRQQFLMSGVPEELRKQTARVTSQILADYPPLPIISHVLQIPNGTEISAVPKKLDIWNLPTVQLDLRQLVVPRVINTTSRFNGNLVEQWDHHVDVSMFKKFKSHPLTDTEVDLCLKEISLCNTSYPTVDMFRSLKEMKIEAEQIVAKTDMKGILGACTDLIMVDDAENGKREKKTTKKGLKRKKKGVGNCILEQDKTSEKIEVPNIAGSAMLWTEKYSPTKSSDMLGNSGLLKKLSKWLNDWRHILDKEARKAQKLLLEKNKRTLTNTKGDDADWDSSSDFDIDSDNSEDDMSLCNTMLLRGPHGCGKTSSVYALAQELGFKVHEVNASSCRSGKHILSQLQEATQSHQVTGQGNHTPKKNAAVKAELRTDCAKMPKAFTNILAAANTYDAQGQSKGSNKVKRGLDMASENNPKKRLRHKLSEGDDGLADKSACRSQSGNAKKKKFIVQNMEEASSHSVPQSINLSSTTLILFDEVDIVLEEDKGFLSAVQTFMSTTKIPIILTSADPSFQEQLEGRFEIMMFQRPTTESITSHLQTIALCEGLRLDPWCLSEMIQYFHNDIRRCIVMLQYLLQTGGAQHQVSKRFPDHLDNIKESVNSKQPNELLLSSQNSDNSKITQQESDEKTAYGDSDDEFVVLKPLKKRMRIIEDENSNSYATLTAKKYDDQVLVMNNAMVKKEPVVVHCVGIESLVGLRSQCLVDTLSHGVKARSNVSIQELATACDTFKKTTNTDLLYNNLHHLLPFPVNIVDRVVSVSQPVGKVEQSRKRIRVNSGSIDLYDNEMSRDSSKLETVANNEEDLKVRTDVGNCKEENKVLIESLSAFSRFYETMSSLDMYESVESVKRMDKLQCNAGQPGIKGTLVAGVKNVHSKHWRVCELDMDTCNAFHSEIESHSARKMYGDIEIVYNKAEKLKDNNTEFSGNFVLPVMKREEQFTTLEHSTISIPRAYESACDNTIQSLPIPIVNQQRNVHLDYLPTLREICRTEQCRQIANTKRRFQHYFHSITLPLKDKSICTLATTFIT